MRIPESVRDKFQPLDSASFERIRKEKLRPSYNRTGLDLLRQKAQNERNLRELYRGRAPYELLQNADDAGADRAALILSAEGLAFAHNGSWFTVDNFLSLADGWSDKHPDQCIGHKGLGFRSVLDITPAPYLVKVEPGGFFAVKFTWALNKGHINETLRRNPSLREDYVKWTAHGQMVCPVMAIPGLANKFSLEDGATILEGLVRGVHGGDFTTMFWFPSADRDIDSGVLRELGPVPIAASGEGQEVLCDFLENQVSVLLPFLGSVREVSVYDGEQCIALARMQKQPLGESGSEVTIRTEVDGDARTDSFFQMRFASVIPPEIKNQPDTPRAVRAMTEAKVLLSARLQGGQPVCDAGSVFHVYFPTEESTGLGYTVHGDFYVKPDRTRLMDCAYNNWLLRHAASLAANEFLTELLRRYSARASFAALAPTGVAVWSAAEDFVDGFSTELQGRSAPFVPTTGGFVERDKAVLPPTIDSDGFWESHFSDVVGDAMEEEEAFLAPNEDGEDTRRFLGLAEVHVLEPKDILAFIEASTRKGRPSSWWYDCYSYIVEDKALYVHDRSFFTGRKLIPTTDSSVIPVPGGQGLVVCLPPTGDISSIPVPDCFSVVFVFLDSSLADRLESGEDRVRTWILDRFGISRFEATELLPRAMRGVDQQLFSGEVGIGFSELAEAWDFIRQITGASRTGASHEIWQEVGRFPLPVDSPTREGTLDPASLVPAFLCYWPDSLARGGQSLSRLEGLRRVDEAFIEELMATSEAFPNEWLGLFRSAGVSSSPKMLQFRRVPAAGEPLILSSDAPSEIEQEGFCGFRQRDENRAVVRALSSEDLWGATVIEVEPCGHDLPRELRSLTLLEGIGDCTRMAELEYHDGDDNWRDRLWSIVEGLSAFPLAELEDDSAHCRGGGPGGHQLPAGSYLRRQLQRYRWLPSSQGPASSAECFLRLPGRRLISSGRLDEELGDILLPYVVVDDWDDYAKFSRLGVEVLDDAASASSSALVRALALLGERLSTEWGREEVLEVRSVWRLVRGAIQEIYRCLNQPDAELDWSPAIKLATRSNGAVSLRTAPLYYAEPGSVVEQAFADTLPLLDADRLYRALFEQIGVTRLTPGETLEEEFLDAETSTPADRLRDEIVNDLAPFLLAPIIARSDKPKHHELVLRRLQERFEVMTAERLTVSFSLTENPAIERSVDFPNFYLHSRLIAGPGARQETHYILYVAGDESISLLNPALDADALGAAVAPVFLDGMSGELAQVFPRIVSRYQHARGNRPTVEDFLHRQLNLSKEAQDTARAIVSGEHIVAAAAPPPPPVIIRAPSISHAESVDSERSMTRALESHKEKLGRKTDALLAVMIDSSRSIPGHKTPRDLTAISPSEEPMGITPEQEERGVRGEEEIKRRLELPGGWGGFSLRADMRLTACGYDFLAATGERDVELEVKTFSRDGRVVVTSRELQQAAVSQEDYYLVGVLDDGGPENDWPTFSICNPAATLLSKGEFDIQAKLQAPAAEVFEFADQSD